MATFEKVRRILEKEEACVISKHNNPKYVAMTWNKYQQMVDELRQLRQLRESIPAREMDDEFDVSLASDLQYNEDGRRIDIHSIPV